MTTTTTITAFSTLHDGQDWSVDVDYSTGWVRVYDGGTAYLLDGHDERTLAAMQAYIDACEAADDASEPERKADAYSDFCQDTRAFHAVGAPADVVASMAELLDMDADDLTWGW